MKVRYFVWHFLWMSLSIVSLAAGAANVKLEAKCPDEAIEYDMRNHAIAEIKANPTSYKLVSDESADISIRIIGVPVRVKSTDQGAPLGISFATLVTRKNGSGISEVRKFDIAFVPLSKIEESVKVAIRESLK